jgi:two-component system, OmpR family, manganese sensing response regulator
MAKILVVDNEKDLCDSIGSWLTSEGHHADTSYDGRAALAMLCRNQYDLAVMDAVLPELDGISVCRLYRELGGSTRILLVTGRDEIADREAGLDAGADDVAGKPMNLRELSARLRALMRRSLEVSGTVLQVGNLTLHTGAFLVCRGDERISLHPQEFALLAFLMKHPNLIFTTETLITRVWHGSASVDTVRTHVKTLRKKIEHPSSSPHIKTIHGIGYCLSDEN